MVSGAPRPWGRTLPPLQRHGHRRAPPQTPHRSRGETTMGTTNKQSAENAAPHLESANTVAAQAAGAIEASVEQIRELNERAITAARAAGQRALDAYQAALESVVDAEKKLAEGQPTFTTLVTTQAEFTQRLGAIFLTTAREQLK